MTPPVDLCCKCKKGSKFPKCACMKFGLACGPSCKCKSRATSTSNSLNISSEKTTPNTA